jgi:acyl carrier protein
MIDSSEFVAKLTEIFRQECEKDNLKITMQTVQSDIESWDSLAHVRIVMGVERAYNIQLDVAEIESINSVRAFYEAVTRHEA